jgi:hypothetical protein
VPQSCLADGHSQTMWKVDPPADPAAAQCGQPRRALATSHPERRSPFVLRNKRRLRLELSGRSKTCSQSRRPRAFARRGECTAARRSLASISSSRRNGHTLCNRLLIDFNRQPALGNMPGIHNTGTEKRETLTVWNWKERLEESWNLSANQLHVIPTFSY